MNLTKIVVVAAGFVLAACGTDQGALPVAPPSAQVPGNQALGHSVDRHGEQVAAVTVAAEGLVYQHSADGGRTWQRSPLPVAVPTKQAAVALTEDGTRVGVMLVQPSGSARGGLPALFTGPAAGPLVARQAPVAGDLGWAGHRLVLAGGPQRSLLYSSGDGGATWRQLGGGGRFDVPADAPSYGAPLTTSDGVVMPVTLHGKRSSVRLDVSEDGVRVKRGVEVAVTGEVGLGTAVLVAEAGPGGFVVVDPAGTLHVVRGARQETITPIGLRGAIGALTFTDAVHGAAEVTIPCQGKENCAPSVITMTTVDGGRSWS